MGHSQEVTHLACVATALPLIAQNNSQQDGWGGPDSKQRTVFCLLSLEDPENIACVN